MGDTSSGSNENWGSALRDNAIWFVLALILAAVTSYFGFRLEVEGLAANVARAEEDIETMQRDIREYRRARTKTQLDIARLEAKINALLIERGIDPARYGQGTQEAPN